MVLILGCSIDNNEPASPVSKYNQFMLNNPKNASSKITTKNAVCVFRLKIVYISTQRIITRNSYLNYLHMYSIYRKLVEGFTILDI